MIEIICKIGLCFILLSLNLLYLLSRIIRLLILVRFYYYRIQKKIDILQCSIRVILLLPCIVLDYKLYYRLFSDYSGIIVYLNRTRKRDNNPWHSLE